MLFQKKTFKDEEVLVDGNQFIECEFRNCVLQYGGGGGGVVLTSCQFDGCRWAFIRAAGDTVSFMKDLYHGGWKDVIERTFEDIRRAGPSAVN